MEDGWKIILLAVAVAKAELTCAASRTNDRTIVQLKALAPSPFAGRHPPPLRFPHPLFNDPQTLPERMRNSCVNDFLKLH